MEFGTDETPIDRLPGETAKLTIKMMPVMGWVTLRSNGIFGPFVRGGLGATRLDYAEEYSLTSVSDTEFEYWSFIMGLGAGIRFSPSPRWELWIFGADFLATGSKTEVRESGREVGFKNDIGLGNTGIRVIYWF